MNRLQWRLGTAGICSVVLIACTKDQSTKVDTGQTIAQDTLKKMAAPPQVLSQLGGWPNPNIIIGATQIDRTKKVLRLHMDVPVATPISQALEAAVAARQGHAVLEMIKDTLKGGYPYSWAMLKAPLLCSHNELAVPDTNCSPRSAPSGPKGEWANPDIQPWTDYAPSNHPAYLQIMMDIKFRKTSTGAPLESALQASQYAQVLKLLVADGAIVAGKDSVAWATLKAAFRCNDYLPTDATC
jgi:hypothetical protein